MADVRLSKSLSTLLRHQAHNDGVNITSDGWVLVSDAVTWLQRRRGIHSSEAAIRSLVAANDKQRYTLRESAAGLSIRANQGHTMRDISVEMAPVADDVTLALHGTYHHAWPSIRAGGLSRMKRQHVHLARGLPGESGTISGMRSSCEVLVWVDVRRARAAGLQFFESSNGVILTPGDSRGAIPAEFFARVDDRRTGAVMLAATQTDAGAAHHSAHHKRGRAEESGGAAPASSSAVIGEGSRAAAGAVASGAAAEEGGEVDATQRRVRAHV